MQKEHLDSKVTSKACFACPATAKGELTMKPLFNIIILTACLLASLTACGESGDVGSASNTVSENILQSSDSEPAVCVSSEELSTGSQQISVQFGEQTVVYALNDSIIASSLLAQLPLTVEVEDYSTNEKIFYPPETLDTTDAPMATGGAGTLAYYAPWGNVVMFYGDYNANSSLFELGQVIAGGELIDQMTGTITISAMT